MVPPHPPDTLRSLRRELREVVRRGFRRLRTRVQPRVQEVGDDVQGVVQEPDGAPGQDELEEVRGRHHEVEEHVDPLPDPTEDQEEELVNELRTVDDEQAQQPVKVYETV